MQKSLLIIILIVCIGGAVGALGYSIYNAIATSKRNKATDEANQQMFLARNKEYFDSVGDDIVPAKQSKKAVVVVTPEMALEEPKPKKKALDYDTYEDAMPLASAGDKRLKDFFTND